MQDKIKEALFSTLESLDLDINRVLDLYSGTGGIGIEALSRGAVWCDFVDHQRAACDVIRWNLNHTQLADRSRVHQSPVPVFISQPHDPYDLVMMDPPYADPQIRDILEQVGSSKLVESGAIIALGHWPKFVHEPEVGRAHLIKRRCHGDSCFSIYEVQ
jgi:16S rRNA (guanine966-N2)-methyltransferase